MANNLQITVKNKESELNSFPIDQSLVLEFSEAVEDSYLDACGEFETVSPRINKEGPNQVEFSEHNFYQDSNGKWFFILTKCKHFRGKVYGYEFGWRRKDLNGTNLVTRVYFGKPIEKKAES